MRPVLNLICILITAYVIGCWVDYLAHNFYAAEWLLARMGVGWLWVSLLSRIIIAIGFAGMVNVFLSPSPKKLVLHLLALLVLLVYTEAILSTPFGRFYHNSFFTGILYNVQFRIAFYALAVIAGLVLYSANYKWSKKDENPVTFFLAVTMAVVMIMFAIRPMYIDDFENRESTALKDASLQNQRLHNRIDRTKPALLFYFSTTCDHCFYMYHRLEASAEYISPQNQVYLVMEGTDIQYHEFIAGEKVPFAHKLVPDSVFFVEAGPRLPASYEMQNGKNTHYRVGDQFNYLTLSRICD